MNLVNPSLQLLDQYSTSYQICLPLINQYFSNPSDFDPIGTSSEQQEIKKEVILEQNNNLTTFINELKKELDVTARYSLELSIEKGASTWLSTLLLKARNFHLNKLTLKDVVHLCYGLTIPDIPSTCQYGSNFSLDHILSCPKGGFPTIQRNEVRDITSSLLSEVYSNVVIEPHLQPLTGEQLTMRSGNTDANARLDIAANGV